MLRRKRFAWIPDPIQRFKYPTVPSYPIVAISSMQASQDASLSPIQSLLLITENIYYQLLHKKAQVRPFVETAMRAVRAALEFEEIDKVLRRHRREAAVRVRRCAGVS